MTMHAPDPRGVLFLLAVAAVGAVLLPRALLVALPMVPP